MDEDRNTEPLALLADKLLELAGDNEEAQEHARRALVEIVALIDALNAR